jgi:hypothetical protein
MLKAATNSASWGPDTAGDGLATTTGVKPGQYALGAGEGEALGVAGRGEGEGEGSGFTAGLGDGDGDALGLATTTGLGEGLGKGFGAVGGLNGAGPAVVGGPLAVGLLPGGSGVPSGCTCFDQSIPRTLPGGPYWQTYVGHEQAVLMAQPRRVVESQTSCVKWPVEGLQPGLEKSNSFTWRWWVGEAEIEQGVRAHSTTAQLNGWQLGIRLHYVFFATAEPRSNSYNYQRKCSVLCNAAV